MVFGKVGVKMIIKNLLKEWRILLVAVSVILAILAIGYSPQGEGVVVKSVSTDSPLFGKLLVGDTLTWVNEKTINSPEDLFEFENYTGVFRFIHNGGLDLANIDTPGLKIEVEKRTTANLNFGLDLVGGTRVLLKPKENVTDAVMQQIIATLETRINLFGLKEAKFQQVNDVTGNKFVQVETAGSREDIENLLARQGKFEAKIPRTVTFVNNSATLVLSSSNLIEKDNQSIFVNGRELRINDTSTMEGIDFLVSNITNTSATLTFIVFTGDDIKSVCIQDQPGICSSSLIQQSGGWEFNFQVFISQGGADKFAKVTNSSKVITQSGGGRSLEDRIQIFLDDDLVTELSISPELKGKAFTTPSITGFRETRDEALREKLTLQSILQSGSLPVSLEITRIDQISASLGQEFFRTALLAGVIASVSVAGVIFVRYRKVKILIPMMLWSVFELILTLGVASVIKWTIDLASIAGIIAAIGTGTNDQIIMIDEILEGGKREKMYTVKQRLKRAFFIVFGAASTIVAAMLPLMFIGIGVMRGFAIITTIGVLIGVFITRPAFGRLAEKLLGEEEIKQ